MNFTFRSIVLGNWHLENFFNNIKLTQINKTPSNIRNEIGHWNF